MALILLFETYRFQLLQAGRCRYTFTPAIEDIQIQSLKIRLSGSPFKSRLYETKNGFCTQGERTTEI